MKQSNKKTEDKKVPNPGSQEAMDQGCTCPVLDNNYGAGMPNRDNNTMFWYNSDCPLHGFYK